MTNGWVYMLGDEHTSETFETKEEAIAEGLSVHGEDEWSSGEILRVGYFETFKPHISVENVLERIMGDSYDCGGEYSYGYLEDVTEEQEKELEEELNGVLQKWIEKHGFKANFGEVYKCEEIEQPLATD